ncbi:MAG: Cyclic di-GMP phosphodiesterase response regulator RpfG [Planctomycetes bacterium ADurb.Bin126]|nr:MAG: Cyclic di-GMP phosphodiesterase response regulator RpfG [Planctomycetes bacterium ADurb.Bin126]HOD82201.1 response regulator [Phycisphaerae bacterium]HQL73073.1 response regulator [Phycisphaerae bacterium]
MVSKSVRVLVVDDEPGVCDLVQQALRQVGATCAVAFDNASALQLLAEEDYSVIIADVCLGDRSGLDLLAHVRRHNPACHVILITAAHSTTYLADAIRLGAFDYLHKPFSIESLKRTYLRAASPDAAVALPLRAARALQLESQHEQALMDGIRALAGAVEAKDPYTRRHSEQVAHYAFHLAVHVGLDHRQTESIRVAALVHDIGKIGVPDVVLSKPGPLSDAEFALVRRHPELGADIVRNMPTFAREADLVLHHHERWDGQGYPNGVAGRDIPLGARIIQLADSIDAMLMPRLYKGAYPLEHVIAEIRQCAGEQFDPELSRALLDWLSVNPSQVILPSQTAVA